MYMGNDLCVRKTRVRDRWSILELDQGSKRGNGMREWHGGMAWGNEGTFT